MSSFLSSKFLKYRDPANLAKIEEDLPCASCGYNLRGLNYGRNCPECGTPIEKGAAADLLLSGDERERNAWRIGLAIAGACVTVATGARLLIFPVALAVGADAVGAVYVATGLLLSALWTAAVWMITPASLVRRWPRLAALRWFGRLAALLFPVAYVCLLAEIAGATGSIVAIGRLLRLVAAIGAIVLAFMLARVADEAGLDRASRRFNAVVWLLPIATVILQLFGRNIYFFIAPAMLLFLALWVWVMLRFALALWELQRHVSWAMVHARESLARDQRVRTTREALEREVEAKVRPLPAPPSDIPLDPSSQ